MRTLALCSLLLLALAAPAAARVPLAKVSRVSASATKAGVRVRFTLANRRKVRVTATLNGKAKVRRTLKAHRARRVTLTARVGSGSWTVRVCARRSCARARKPVTLTAKAAPGGPVATPAPGAAAGPGETRNLGVDAGHTSALDVPTPTPPLRVHWTRADFFPRSTLIAGGRIYGVGEGGDQTLLVAALDPASGATLWEHRFTGGSNGGIAYDAGRVFVTHAFGTDALDGATGAVAWSMASSERDPLTPVADGGQLFAETSTGVTRYDEATGALVWSYAVQATDDGYARIPTLDATRVWAGDTCTPLLRTSGAAAGPAMSPCPDAVDSPVTPLSAGHLLVEDLNHINQWMDYDTGANAFGKSFAGGALAIEGSWAISSTGRGVQAYGFPSWTPLWSWDAGEATDNLPPLIVGQHVYVTNADSTITALNLVTGRVEWTMRVGGYFFKESVNGVPIAMSAGDGLLLAPTSAGLVAFGD